MVRVLQVCPYFPPYPGGQEKHVAHLAAELSKLGHEVRILTSDFGYDDSHEDPQGIQVVRLPTIARALRNPIISPAGGIRKHFEWADVIHAHNEHAFLSNLAAGYGPRVGAPSLLTCHGQLRFEAPIADAIETLYSKTLGSWTLSRMNRVIALSPTDQSYLRGLGVPESAVRIIPNGIRPPQPAKKSVTEALRDRLALDDGPILLFIGPLLKRKNPLLVLETAPRILQHFPDAIFLFLGSGEMLEPLKVRSSELGISDQVRLPGYVTDEELAAALELSDLLLFPSVSEGLPTTILEALWFHLPVVASNLPAIQDWFSEVCELTEPTQEGFEEAVLNALQSPAKVKQMAAVGRELVEGEFLWEGIAQNIAAEYIAQLESSPPQGERTGG